jgi:aryl-alcohol dehydrogenase-like predicted oxidoreductase
MEKTTNDLLTKLRPVGASDLLVSPLTLGTNVFGWTIDENEAFAVLDAYTDLGGNSIDTADVYSFWGNGNSGGEAETIIGKWLLSRKPKEQVVISTKAGAPGGRFGDKPDSSSQAIRARVTASLARLQVDRITLFYLHAEDPRTETEELATTLCELVHEGLIGYTAVSNYSPEGFRALYDAVSAINPAVAPIAMQPHWSLVRRETEAALLRVAKETNASILPYWGLEKGFLTGKYRQAGIVATTQRQQRHRPHELLNTRGRRILSALDIIAEEQQVNVGAVALAWLLHHDQVPSVIASARNPKQLEQIAQVGEVDLSSAHQRLLSDAAE